MAGTDYLGNLANLFSRLGLTTMARMLASNVVLTGGSMDGVTVGANTPAPASFTSLSASATATFAQAPVFTALQGYVYANTTGALTASKSIPVSALGSIASGSILSNITSGSAAPVGNALSAILDQLIGSTRGALVYRSSAGWTALNLGSTGFLVSNGTDLVFNAIDGGEI